MKKLIAVLLFIFVCYVLANSLFPSHCEKKIEEVNQKVSADTTTLSSYKKMQFLEFSRLIRELS